MAFVPANLPDRKWLKPSEVVYFLAFEEVFDERAIREAEYPSDRTYGAEIKETKERCLEEAFSSPESYRRCAAFVELFADAPSSIRLGKCRSSWPQSGERLYLATLELERQRRRLSMDVPMDHAVYAWYEAPCKKFLNHCIDEALANPSGWDFFKVVFGTYDSDHTFVPPSAKLRECEAAWPPSGYRLHELVGKWEQAQEADELKLSAAEHRILSALVSGYVTFQGERDGQMEAIDVCLFGSAPKIDRDLGTVEALSDQWGRDPGRTYKWTGVCLERASLMAWLDGTANSPPNEAPPTAGKMTPGRMPYDKQWCIMKPLACKIYMEDGPYDRSVGFTQAVHAQKTIGAFQKLQKDEPTKYGRLKVPQSGWMTKKLRGIRPELDKLPIKYD